MHGIQDPVIQLIEDKTGEVVYTLRIRGNSLRPRVFSKAPHTLKVQDAATGKTRILKGIKPAPGKLTVKF